jgi:protein-S-isoprenylcysteine O-methyltransferase Ste14
MLLALRALFWTLAFPGFFAFYVPWTFFGLRAVDIDLSQPRQLLGLLCIDAGTILLLACIWEFAHRGRGTLSPVDPPKHLVVSGLYRYVRNPMYLSVTTIVFGELLLVFSPALLVYWIIWFTAVNLFVMGYEEPTLREQFGQDYERYARAVGRWLPRLSPYRP